MLYIQKYFPILVIEFKDYLKPTSYDELSQYSGHRHGNGDSSRFHMQSVCDSGCKASNDELGVISLWQ